MPRGRRLAPVLAVDNPVAAPGKVAAALAAPTPVPSEEGPGADRLAEPPMAGPLAFLAP